MNDDISKGLMKVRAELLTLGDLIDKSSEKSLTPALKQLSELVNTIQNEYENQEHSN
ncbi:hypothetical protein PQ472_08970 [Lacticaseibacillus pabuli]|uniref:Spo0E like sporulation regulatory protein n=1 Tax=Lacticaseibacillus pabuli TaxID=3025672 RepID=A0ABY7WPC8_9LACO|nr:hypothetical protein [Lacticaseibacillus sp. KACC 23028]WDF82050.1 hypothetical protein PQ472_08970 [Lacticaseibacillus sp. KACC 23028]